MGGDGDLAAYGARAGATVIDAVIVGTVAFVAASIAIAAGVPVTATGYVLIGAVLLSSLLYAPLLMCRSGAHNGQTVGKQALSIRVVRQDAEPVTAATAIQREFVAKGLLGLIPFFTIVDFLFPLGDPRGQAIHDKIASTFVVRADAVPNLDSAGTADAFGTLGPERPSAPAGWAPPGAPEARAEPGRGANPPAADRAPAPAPDAPAPGEGVPATDAPLPASDWAPPAAEPPAPAALPDFDDEVRGPFGPSSAEPDPPR